MNPIDTFIHQNLSRPNWPIEPLLQLLMAALAGGLIGFEREVRGRQAGLRTNLLVCVGCALVMIVSINMAFHDFPRREDVRIQVDPGRIAYGVMAGIGFLGAGVIVRHRMSVHGLTTAAAMWCVAAIGLAAGMGLYVLVFFAVLIVLVVLWLLSHFERWIPHSVLRTITLRRQWNSGCVNESLQMLRQIGVIVNGAEFERTDDLRNVDIHVSVSVKDLNLLYNLEQKFAGDQNYELIRIQE